MIRHKDRFEEAKTCDNCLCWLKYCMAECCRQFHFPLGPRSDIVVAGGCARVRIPMTQDRQWYFELHGVRICDDVLVIPETHCAFKPGLLSVSMPCSLLTADNLCSGHPENKPVLCRNLTLNSAREGIYHLTSNCLFAYKKER